MSRQGRYTQYLGTYLVEMPVMEDRITPDGLGTMSVAVGMQTHQVQVCCDPIALKVLAYKATKNKSRSATDGPLTAIVIELRK